MVTKLLVFYSGGMDSRICLDWAIDQVGDNVEALYVDFGHQYAGIELEKAKQVCAEQDIELYIRSFPLGDVEQADGHIPLRNLYLLEMGTMYSNNLVFGMLYHETSNDKNPRFVHKMERLLTQQFTSKEFYEENRRIKILTPFADATKTEMLRWYIQEGFEVSRALDSISCYSSVGKCGQCMSCFNRWVACVNNDIHEEYLVQPYEWALEKLAVGKKKRQSLTSLPALWYKRRYVKELYNAFSTVVDDPVRLAWEVYKEKSTLPLRRRI